MAAKQKIEHNFLVEKAIFEKTQKINSLRGIRKARNKKNKKKQSINYAVN